MGMHIPHGMQQFAHLPLASPHDGRVAMPRRGHTKGGGEI
jgi:hypothetical protein